MGVKVEGRGLRGVKERMGGKRGYGNEGEGARVTKNYFPGSEGGSRGICVKGVKGASILLL